MDNGRPFGISAVAARDSLRELELDLELEECLEEELEDFEEEEVLEEDLDEEEDLEDDLEEVTSRMLRTRPVVGSVVESSAGLWETW